MAAKANQTRMVSDRLISRWEQVGQKLVNFAQEIPEDQFEYRPIQGTRTFAEVLRHVAYWNRYVAERGRGRKGDDNANELPKEKFSSKKQILGVLKQSIADVLSALKEWKGDLSPEMAEMVVTFIEHNCEHYGQLVVYARLNGIVPPASRG